MKVLYNFTAFASGFIIMSLEILGFRALAPHFGYSIYVFGALIGLILLALALGYWVGGLLSLHNVKPRNFFLVLLLASLYLAAASSSYEYILQYLASYGVIAGALLATLVLWAFPMIALAAISPYLVGMMSEKEHPGRSSGKVSAAGTVGGLAGTFLTSFYLLPVFGTHATFAGNVYGMTVVTLVWLLTYNRKWLLAGILVPFLANLLPSAKLPTNVVHAEESAYSHLEVVDGGDIIFLRTDRRSGGAYSVIKKDGSLPPIPLYNMFAVPIAAKKSERGLLLGVGAGTLPHIHEMLNPELSLVGVEIDPRVIAIGNEFFGLGNLDSVESITISDARAFLAKDTETHDLIEMDIFRETEIPFYMVSKEFFELTKERLNDGGILMMNIYDPTPGKNIQRRVTNTAASVYTKTYLVPAGLGSYLLIGSNAELVVPSIGAGGGDERLANLTEYFREHVQEISFSADLEVFTDDLAPIETLYVAPLAEIL